MDWRRLQVGGCLALSFLFSGLFYFRYWRWRDCIAQAHSSCVTPGGDNLTTGGMIWVLPAMIFAAAALKLALKR